MQTVGRHVLLMLVYFLQGRRGQHPVHEPRHQAARGVLLADLPRPLASAEDEQTCIAERPWRDQAGRDLDWIHPLADLQG